MMDMSHRIGNYVGTTYTFSRVIDGATVTVFIYGAYDAYGLIGSEENGIGAVAVRGEDRVVLMDRHMCAISGYFGPTRNQFEEFNRLKKLSNEELTKFLRTHSRYRTNNGVI